VRYPDAYQEQSMSPTSRTNRIATTIVATVATALATAGGASAETYCVADPGCSGIAVADVQTALTTAAKTVAPDRIEVGPGTFDTSDGFVYAGAGATNTVELVGAGREQTELRSAGGVNGHPAVLLNASAPSRISDLTITSDDPPKGQLATGLRIFGTAERIKVHAGASSDGVELLKGSTLTSSKVAVPDQRFAVRTDHPGAGVSNSSIDAPAGYGVEASGSGSLTVSHSSLNANVGLTAYAGTVKIDNSLVVASNIGLFALDDGTTGGTLDATNVTVVGADSFVTGAESVGTNPGAATLLTVENSAIAQTAHPLLRSDGNGGTASLIVKHSAYDHSTVIDLGSGSIDQAQSNLDLKALGFVDPAVDDYHLAADSPLRDAGDPAPAGGLATTDLGKNPRSVDGNGDGTAAPDIGAFEFQPPPAPPVTPTGPATPDAPVTPPDFAPVITTASLTHRKFSIGRAPRRGTAFRLTLSKAATVKIAIRGAKRATGTLKRASHKGANRIAFSGRIGRRALKPGRYVATITAADASGKRSAPRTLRFTVVKR
jgi:hypothetical protein